MTARQPPSYRQRLALAVGSLRSRLAFAVPEIEARIAWRNRMVRASVYEDNHGAALAAGYRNRLWPQSDSRETFSSPEWMLNKVRARAELFDLIPCPSMRYRHYLQSFLPCVHG